MAIASLPEDINYDSLNEKWQKKALLQDPLRDPRSDSDQLRPVLNYDCEIIQIHSFAQEHKELLVGEGWQLVGGVVDVFTQNNSRYILYGRRNLRYETGLWNNVLNVDQSFEDFLVVKFENNQAEVLINKRLISTTAQILIGIRQTEDASGFEVIQNSPSGQWQIIWSYQF